MGLFSDAAINVSNGFRRHQITFATEKTDTYGKAHVARVVMNTTENTTQKTPSVQRTRGLRRSNIAMESPEINTMNSWQYKVASAPFVAAHRQHRNSQ
jgi:hypothetical protein